MDIKQMRYFVAIAEQGSLAAAANSIGIAQPSLSQQVKNLEERIGTDLLVRSSRGVTMTEAGATFLEHARSILSAVERAEEEVRIAASEPTGTVVFGFPSSVSMVLSVPLAETIRHDYPSIKLRAVDAMSGFIKGWLEDGKVDLAILYEMNAIRNVESRLLLNEDLYFYSAHDNWPLDTPPGEPTSLKNLSDVEMVLPSQNHGLRILIDRFCKSFGVSLRIEVEMDSLTQIKTLVSRGSTHTILAPAAAYDFESSGQLLSAPIIDPVIRRPVVMIRRPGPVVTRASLEVEGLTVRVVEELVRRNIWKGHLADDVAARPDA
ncbi:MAG: LysR substrate-binding domain-containing protein [Pseudomonadota bacterium]